MRRFFLGLLCVLMLLGVCNICLAADGGNTQIADMKTDIVIAEDSSCVVTNQFVVAFSGHDKEFLIPLGENASDYAIGVMADVVERGSTTCYLLSNSAGLAGQQSFTVTYSLPVQAVAVDDDTQMMDLSVLASGFSCTIENWTVNVTFPKELEGVPTLSSGSHGDTAFNDFNTSINGQTFTAVLLGRMNENDSLRLKLETPTGFFNLSNLPGKTYVPMLVLFLILLAAALGYWGIFLRNPIILAKPRKFLPPNVTAGEVGYHISCDEPDLAALIVEWANLGYLTIKRTAKDRIVLIREMEMGNERRPVESKLFRSLFRKEGICEVQSFRYRNTPKRMSPPFRAYCNGRMFHPKSGTSMLLQLFGALASAAAGVCVFDTMFSMFSGRWVLVAFLAVVFGALGWMLQRAVIGTLRRRPIRSALRGVLLMLLLPLVSEIGGVGLFGVLNVLSQILIGAMAIFGGRRSEDGVDLLVQIMGYRRNLRSQRAGEIAQLVEREPQYFYQTLPYAEAFGVANSFVKHCGSLKLEPCPWLRGWKKIPNDPARFYLFYQSLISILRQEDEPGFWGNLVRNFSGRRRRVKASKGGRRAAPRKPRAASNTADASSRAPAAASHVRSHRQGGGKTPAAVGHVRPHRRSVEEDAE